VAASNGDEEMVLRLLRMGANPLMADRAGRFPLHDAVKIQMGQELTEGRLAVVRHLAADPRAQLALDLEQLTPLMRATHGMPQVFHTLQQVATPEARCYKNTRGHTALKEAVSSGNLEFVRILLSRMPSGCLQDQMADAVSAAGMLGRLRILKILKEEFNAPCPSKLALKIGHCSYRNDYGRRATLQRLVDLFGDSILGDADAIGTTVLGRWAFDGDLEMVKFLIFKQGMNCSEPMRQRRSVTVKELIQRTGQSKFTLHGLTPLGLVQKRIQLLQLLQMRGGDVQLVPHLASYGGYYPRHRATSEVIARLKEVELFLRSNGCAMGDVKDVKDNAPVSRAEVLAMFTHH